ncbi:hypothetical protein EDD18DRAFT_485128 [Armillaria luteobubalina]|uniref:Uncharacterized protein n=1 Tax=Armillaria luteobubalina TaxID=153913 RepID=A0AA39UZ33_9AGAR|nr:hypothetical protein EDD18DRAFT_485128 [Armillaria luteobubalina]
MSTAPFDEPLRSGDDSLHRSIQDDAKEDMPLEVIKPAEARKSLRPYMPSLSTYFDDLARIIAGNCSSPASSDDSKEMFFNNKKPTYFSLAFREAQVDRIFHDALSRNGPLSNGLHGEADTDYLVPSTGAESACAPGCTTCGLQILAPYAKKLSREVHSFLSKQNGRVHSMGIDAVDPLLLDSTSQAFLEDYLALHAPFEPEPDDNSDVIELNVGTDKVEDVSVDPGDSVPAVKKKGRTKRERARKQKQKIAQSPKENKDDEKENVPEILKEPMKDRLKWIRDLPPMKHFLPRRFRKMMVELHQKRGRANPYLATKWNG